MPHPVHPHPELPARLAAGAGPEMSTPAGYSHVPARYRTADGNRIARRFHVALVVPAGCLSSASFAGQQRAKRP